MLSLLLGIITLLIDVITENSAIILNNYEYNLYDINYLVNEGMRNLLDFFTDEICKYAVEIDTIFGFKLNRN